MTVDTANLALEHLEYIITLRKNFYYFHSQREKVFTVKKLSLKSKNMIFTFKKWVFDAKN